MVTSVEISDTEIGSIENILRELYEKKSHFEKELSEVEAVIDVFEKIRQKPGYESRVSDIRFPLQRRQGIPDKVVEILNKANDKLHIKTIHEELTVMGVDVTRKSLTALISSYADKYGMFKKEGENYFSLTTGKKNK